jgi:uncharacterized protein
LGVSVFAAALFALACRHERGTASLPDAGGIEVVPSPLRLCEHLASCEAECREGNAEQCLRAGTSYSTAQGAPKDERRAAQLLARACDLGNGPACTFAGRMFEYAHGVERDLVRADTLYELGCTRDDPSGCYNAAIMLENGRGTAPDKARAAALYRRVCSAGSSVACAAASRLEPAVSTMDGAAR